MSFWRTDDPDDTTDDETASADDARPDLDRARYRALALNHQVAENTPAPALDNRCATKGCYADPTTAVYLLDNTPRAYCNSCAYARLADDPAAREYPLAALGDPEPDAIDAVGPVTLDRIKEDADEVWYELSCNSDASSGEAFISAANSTDDPQYGSESVVNLEDAV